MKLLTSLMRRGRRRGPRRSGFQLWFDTVEDRVLLTNYLVNSAADTNTGTGTAGTLRYVLNQLATTGTATNLIQFAISAGSQTISVGSALPSIARNVTVDATSQPGFSGTPLIQVDGGGGAFDGFRLIDGSAGSTIQGFVIRNFAGAAISIQSDGAAILQNVLGTNGLGNQVGILIDGASDTRLGGDGLGNTIGFNTQQGVLVLSGNGNTLAQNLYEGRNGPNAPIQANDIVLVPGANNSIFPPQLQTVSIQGSNLVAEVAGVTRGSSVQLYWLTGGALSRRTFLGSAIADLVDNIVTVSIPGGSIDNGAQIVATWTRSDTNSTSAFSNSQTVADLYTVTNVQARGVGSLAQAIINANAHSGLNTISFDITGGQLVIQPTSGFQLPSITDEVVIDGSSQAGIILDGGGFTQDGLVLDTGSGNSTIQGLTIRNFQGAGVRIRSNNNIVRQNTLGASGAGNQLGVWIDAGSSNTIGGASSSLANTIVGNTVAGVQINSLGVASNLVEGNYIGVDSGLNAIPNQVGVLIINSSGNTVGGVANTIGGNERQGVSIVSGIQNVVSQNLYVLLNGPPSSPPQSNDISLGAGANNNQAAPTILTASTTGPDLVLTVFGVPEGSTVEVYQVRTSPSERRIFLGSGPVTLAANGVLTVTVPRGGIGNGDTVTATATVAATGTSAFSAGQTVSDPLVVINANASGPGSLFQSILNANNLPGSNTITFAIPSGSIIATAGQPLPQITGTVVINGPGIILDGGGAQQDGLVLAGGSAGSAISGLTVRNYAGAGIRVSSGGNRILGTLLGSAGSPNQIGVLVDGGSGNLIGGLSGNTIVANTTAGIQISGGATGTLVQANTITANTVGVAVINSTDNTIGEEGLGNTISGNTQQGVSIITGIRNVISGNTYLNVNGQGTPLNPPSGDIVLSPGANNNQPAPTIRTASLSGDVLRLTVSGITAGATVEVYQVTAGPPAQRTLLGSAPAVDDEGVLTVSIPRGSLADGDVIAATATVAANGTSSFSTVQTVGDPLTVTNSEASGVGSLFQAISNANSLPGPNVITFAASLLGQTIFTDANPLPQILDPVMILGPGVVNQQSITIDGNGLDLNGLVLQAGSGGSAITGLTIQNYAGAAIRVVSGANAIYGNILGAAERTNQVGVAIEGGTGNLIGGDTAELGNIITANSVAGVLINGFGVTDTRIQGNTIVGNAAGVQIINSSGNTVGGDGLGNIIGGNSQPGVFIISGINNVVSQNSYTDINGGSVPPPPPLTNPPYGDIVLGAGANNNQAAPILQSIAILNGSFTAQVLGVPLGATIEIYTVEPSPNAARTFFGSGKVTPVNGVPTVIIPGEALPLSTSVVATATVDGNGSSPFSTIQTVSSPLEVRVPDDSGPGSLRAAIDYANSQPGEDRITFKIGTGIQYILLRSALPGIKEKTIIDATTQPRDPSDNSNPLIPIPRIILYGAGVTEQDPRTDLDPVAVPPNPNRSGIYLAPGSDESEVRGLAIVYFNAVAEDFVPLPSAGIEIASASNTIAGNWSGIQPWSSSDATFVNFGYNNLGLYIHGAEATGNTIGEVGIADRNVISGNIGDGIRIEDGGGNQIINAYIGVDLLGSLITDTNQSLILANFGDGIKLSGSSNNIIGGTGAGSLNVISDNILPFKSFYETQYQDASGNGIHLTALELPNPGGQAVLKASTFNTIVNTYIGTDATGTLSSEFTANTGNGIFLEGASGTSIGGATAGGRVLVSGNFGNGIKLGTYVPFDQSLDPLLTTGTTIQNNFVGTDSSGLFTSTSLSNGLNGILLNGASGTTIGGTIALDTQGNRAGNVVSGNLLSGIRLEGNATGNTILGNMVGTTQSGNSDIGNGSSGIQLVDSGNNTIGGTTPGAGNAITGNNGNGILIAGNYAPGAGNLVQGNIIGASTATAQTGGNAFNGIQLVDTTNNTIGGSAIKGGTTLGAGNIITGNGFGSFSRTQLFTTGKSGAQNQGQFAKVAITDSFESIATGAFDGSLGYTAVINQQAISYPDGTTDSFGGPQVVLFTTDATGTSAVPNRLDLSFAVNQFIDPSSEIEIYSGNFLGTASQGRQDSVLITINGSGFSEGVHQAVLLKVIPDTYGLKLDINSAIVWNLDGVPTQVTAGHFLTGKADQFAIALTTSNGEVMVDLFNNKDSEIQRIGTITAPSSSNGFQAIQALLATDFKPIGQNNGLDDLAIAVQTATGAYDINVYRNRGTDDPFDSQHPAVTHVSELYNVQPTAIGAGYFGNSPLNPVRESSRDLVVVGVPVGTPDPATVNGTVFVLKGDGNGNFVPFNGADEPVYYRLGLNSTTVAVGDFQGIGVEDIAVLNVGNLTVPGTVTQLTGNGDGTFLTPTAFDAGLTPSGMVIKAFPGESTPGLAVSNEITSPTGALSPIDVRINLRQLSARRSNGIAITGSESGQNLVQGNSIGIDVNGNQARGNAGSGVSIRFDDGLAEENGTRKGNLIGGGSPGLGNIISGNNTQGISLAGNLGSSRPDVIQGNIIGLDATGNTAFDTVGQALGNILNGVLIEGLAASITGNVISGNGLSGIAVSRSLTVNPTHTTIIGNKLGTNTDGSRAIEVRTIPGQTSNPLLLPLGNALNGILIDNVNDVTIGGSTPQESNQISGNLGRGIEVRGYLNGSGEISIQGNLIGTDSTGQFVTQVDPADSRRRSASLSLGNLGDGIFLLDAKGTQINGTAGAPLVVSGNRGYGIHAVSNDRKSTELTIANVFVGTNLRGDKTTYPGWTGMSETPVFLGNGSDGIFLDRIVGPDGSRTIADSVISGNRANGIHLLDSDAVSIVRSMIGPGASGQKLERGNAGSGIYVNNSSNVTVGGSAVDRNIISGNQIYGVAISASGDGRASNNVVSGNRIGLDGNGEVLPNGVSGVLINNATRNTIGGASNTISGNTLYGVQVNAGSDNAIWGNFIGTGTNGVGSKGNGSDGVFISGAARTQVGGTGTGQGNVIAGNGGNGVQIFGPTAIGNRVAGNRIGIAFNPGQDVHNGGNGVFLNEAGPGNTIGGSTPQHRNIISWNNQAGILIQSYVGAGGQTVEGNSIGTTADGSQAAANRGPGVFINGSSSNTVGGTASGARNLISGNAQSGITIFSPSTSAVARWNVIAGNFIGTDTNGTRAVPNADNGIAIVGGVGNQIGLAESRNVLSGNGTSGVFIATLSPDLPARWNTVAYNFIGTNAQGTAALLGPSQQYGVLVSNSDENTIGATRPGLIGGTNVPSAPSNVISGNRIAGIDIAWSSRNNVVAGNYIGVDRDGNVDTASGGLGNSVGVLLDNAQPNTVGGSVEGAGNLIAQGQRANASGPLTGILIQGPPASPTASFGPGTSSGHLVQGNLIGLDRSGNQAANAYGVRIVNSADNVIGALPGTSVEVTNTAGGARNIISGNTIAGVQISGQNSLWNKVLGNYIGTDPSGTRLIQGRTPISFEAFAAAMASKDPKDRVIAPSQTTGVLIDQARDNIIGSTGARNLISGNLIGVDIEGAAGDPARGSSNVVQGNYIGTDRWGGNPLPNFEYGVYINGSPSNTVSDNVVSANGIAGVLLFGGAPSGQAARNLGNTVIGNKIGTNAEGGLSFPASAGSTEAFLSQHPTILNPDKDGNPDPSHYLPTYLGYQLYGVVIIGSSGNVIGPASQNGSNGIGNLISGNIVVGIYLTSHDFYGNTYAQPFGNPIRANQISSNGMYGVYRYDAPAGSNVVDTKGPRGNRIFANPQSIGDYVSGFSNRATVQANPQSTLLPPSFAAPVNPFQPASAGSSGSNPRRLNRPRRPNRVQRQVQKTPARQAGAQLARARAQTSTQAASAAQARPLVRPRVPALTPSGAKLVRVNHPAIRPGK